MTTEEESPFCPICKLRRRLIFKDGKRARAECCRREGAQKRRLTYKQPDVHGVFDMTSNASNSAGLSAGAETVSREDAKGHCLMVADELT